MKRLALLLGFLASPVVSQELDVLQNCVAVQASPEVSACRDAYVAPCLAQQPRFPHVCYLAETNLWAEQIRRSASPLIDMAEDARFETEQRHSFSDKWRAVNRAIQTNEETCADLQFVDMIDDAYSNPNYFACIMDGHEATLTELRMFLADIP